MSDRPARPASLTRILILDLLLYILQLSALYVSFITNHGSNLPHTDSLPYEDILLPSSAMSTAVEDEDDLDLEGGEARRRRKKGKGSAYSAVGDEEEIWLDEDLDSEETAPLRRCASFPDRTLYGH